MIGSTINNRYLIKGIIGEGGMAIVYLAEDIYKGNRDVAIKIVKEKIAEDPLNLARFQREAKANAALRHKNIVEVYDVSEYHNRPFMVMEYVKSKSLKDILNAKGHLLPREAADVMLQLTDAVSLAHSHGVIHRDLKPQNVLIKTDGTIKLSDFGIATIPSSPSITCKDSVMGSVHYMAPEVAKGKPANALSDIYSLGITFYELLIGKCPFDDDEGVKIAVKHISNPMPSVRRIDPSIPVQYERIIFKACSKDPYSRYSSAREMKMDVMKLLRVDIKDGSKSLWNSIVSFFKGGKK